MHHFNIIAAVLILLQQFTGDLNALKCKCTQNSPKVSCEHGVCEVPDGSSSCLMLDHPNSGLHYACSTSANLSEGECVEKRSKSGANVKVCSCSFSNFCNSKVWPSRQGNDEEQRNSSSHEDENEEEEQNHEISNKSADAPVIVSQLLLLSFPILVIVGISNLM